VRRIFKYGAFVLLLILLSVPSPCQKVGLVLSGGGPRGVTHIGILKALKENNIPIDYIAGTSMGAIIGGLYASGYSPVEIEQLFSNDAMQLWINGASDPRFKHSFMAYDLNASWQMVKIAVDSVLRIKIPTNIISLNEIDFRFLEWFAQAGAACNYNFDSLFIPFRCIASDISESKYMILADGELDKAIRASMTFPFFFKPIRIKNKLMFDGGMYNNFPVDVMDKEFKPDLIIGCKAASNYGPPRDDDVISQIQSMLMANTQNKVDEENGVLIEPKLRPVNLIDFSNTQEFINSGYDAALAQIPKIKKLLKDRCQDTVVICPEEEFKANMPPLKIGEIYFHGINQKQNDYLERLIRKRKLLQKLSHDDLTDAEKMELLKSKYYRIIAENQIESVNPHMLYDPDKHVYNMHFNIDKSNKFEGEVGGLVTSKATNEIFLMIQFRKWSRYLLNLTGNAYLGRFHNSGQGEAKIDIPGNFPLAFELSYTLNGWNYFKTSTYFFEDEKPNYLVQRDSYWKFSLSTPISNAAKVMGEISTGTKTDKYYQTNQFNRLDTTDKTTFTFYSPGIIFEMNSLNRKQFSSEGYFLRLCGRFISGLETNNPGSKSADTVTVKRYHNWFQARLVYEKYFSTSTHFKPGIYLSATLSDKPFFNNYISTDLSVPSFEPIPESQTLFLPQFRADNYAAVGIKLIYNFAKNFEFRAEGYAFQPYREILPTVDNKAVYGKPLSARYYIASGSFVYHTPFGPISMCLNYYDQAEVPFSFNINIGYFIFNRRPFQ
jgi:NTE family protein